MVHLLAIARIMAVKNTVAAFVINPMSRQILTLGRKAPSVFHPTCRVLTTGFQSSQGRVYSAMGWKYITPEMTLNRTEEVGSKILTWMTLTGLFTGVYFWFDGHRKEEKGFHHP